PSMRSNIDSEAERDQRMSEERRLCYVAMTRARERLFLNYDSTRRLFGMRAPTPPPSRFVREIPPECLDRTVEYEPPSQSTPRRSGLFSGFRRSFDRSGDSSETQHTVDPNETRVEYDPEESHGRLRVGMHVRHSSFGNGHITAI